MNRGILRYVLFCVLATFGPVPAAFATSIGITGFSSNPGTTGGFHCVLCHTGGVAPTVTFVGPASAAPGAAVPIILRISGGQNAFGGLDVSATGGTLAAGANNQLLNGEITHKAPVAAVNGVVDFPFTWTAPATLGKITLYGAGVSADGNALNSGDNDNIAKLEINVTNNLPPVANAGGPYMARATVDITFDGSGSTDPDGTIKAYAWDYGDGAQGTGAKSTHAYAKEGSYTVKLTVTDDAGATASATTTATILPATNTAPVANAGGPYISLRKKRIRFDGSGSKDADGSIVSYAWDFGDGGTGTGAKPAHRYSSQGTYKVTLTVTDNDGATGKIETSVKIGP